MAAQTAEDLIFVDRPLPDQDIRTVHRQLSRYHRDFSTQRAWAIDATECFDFFEGNQWNPNDRRKLEREGRPALSWNKIRPRVNLILGYQRSNRYDIRYEPSNDALASSDVADSLNELSQQVKADNRLPWVEAEVFRNGIIGGRGFYDVRLDFSENQLGEINIASLDPFAVYPDSEAQRYEPFYWGHVSVAKWMTLVDIGMLYGHRSYEIMWSQARAGSGSLPGYSNLDIETNDDIAPTRGFGQYRAFSETAEQSLYQVGLDTTTFSLAGEFDPYRKAVRVIDMQHYQMARGRYFVDLQTGQLGRIPDDFDRNKIVQIATWAQQNNQPIKVIERMDKRVRWTVTAADVVLHDAWSPYDSFTIIPYFPYFRSGKTLGMVHDLRDPQREINKRRSAEIHIVNTVAHSGWIYPDNALTPEQEHNLRLYGSMPGIHVKWRASAKQAPERIDPQPPPTAMERLELRANDDMREISGVDQNALGLVDRVQSGKAIEARQKATVTGVEAHLDNLALSRNLLGDKQLNLFQKHYPEQRIVRTKGEDGKAQITLINQRDAAGRIVNDITVGSYTCMIEESPAGASFEAAQFKELMDMVAAGLLPLEVAQDPAIDLSSIPRKREMKARLAQFNQQQAAAAQAAAAAGLPPQGAAQPGAGGGGGKVVPMRRPAQSQLQGPGA